MEDLQIYNVGFMLSASKRRSYRQNIIQRFDIYLRFLQNHDLTTRVLLEPGKSPDDNTVVMRSDLTEEGMAFIREAEQRWFSAVDRGMSPEDTSLLTEAVTKLRGTA